ncbi:MAG: GTP-binding protein [Pirellulaceae bacterium]|nr:MAG: GTP-binding protein [Pirellulaceae bacterium]
MGPTGSAAGNPQACSLAVPRRGYPKPRLGDTIKCFGVNAGSGGEALESVLAGTREVMRRTDIRNIVIIAHVDHGKTTLVDCFLRECGGIRQGVTEGERVLDRHELERERGITILAKNCAFSYRGVRINLIDTPGHADFGGEVERVVRMADGALLLVDAAEGPMPQTRYVLRKALEAHVKPIVVINKIDRPDARPLEVLDETLELIWDLGGEVTGSDFHYIFATAKEGYATPDLAHRTDSVRPLLDMLLEVVPGPEVEPDAPLQMLVTNLDWSSYVGRIAIGRIYAGSLWKNQRVSLVKADQVLGDQKVTGVYVFDQLDRRQVERAEAGDIVAVVGLEQVEIGDTIADPERPAPLPRLHVDEPTLEMIFSVNSSPFAGRDGKYVTTRQLRERLLREAQKNVALRVTPLESGESFAVAGRGVLHLAVLIEEMRREGYELSVGKPHVILREQDGQRLEPFETLVVEVPDDKLGPVMELVGERRGRLEELVPRGSYTHATFTIPARGLIGLRTRLLNATQGTAVMHHRFAGYGPWEGELPRRTNGVMVSNVTGRAVAYSLDNLQQRGDLFIAPGDEVYEGMIVGEHCRENDLPVNPTKEKKLTNIRAAGSDENIILKPPRILTLEAALEYIEDDELVEVTPRVVRLRKILLRESDRRRQSRQLQA